MLRRPFATVLSTVSIRNLLSARHFCAPSSSKDDDKIMTVRTTGVRYTAKNGVDYTTNGVYWGKDDPRNTVINNRHDPTDFQGVLLKSIVKALEQAKADGLKQIHVQSDFKFLKEPDFRKALEKLKMSDFTTWKGQLLPNSEQYEKIFELWNEFDKVILEYRPAWHPNRPGNEVMQLLKEEEKMRNPNASDFTSPDYKCDWEFSPDGTPLAGRMVPTVYVAGKLEVKLNGYKVGSCASLWVPDTIQNLQVKQRPLGSIQRVSIFPVTLFRSQLMAILDALREAQTRKIPEIRIITDSLHFMHFFTTGWRKTDGSPVANEKLFLKIKALTEEIKVHFKGVKYEEECEDDMLKKVHEMASDGLGYPMNNRDTKEYDMKVEELLEGKNDVYAFEGTSTRRARIFKKADGCPLGVLWDRMDGVPLEGAEAESADGCLVGVDKKTPAAMLLAVLEHADRTGLDTIVIRTNQANLVQATLGFLEVWHRYEWNDRRYGQLKEVETWKRIWEIKERIEIVWDLIVDVDEVKDEIYLAKYRKQVRQKKKKTGRPKKKQKGIPE